MAITTQMRTEISQLYVALFGRAPDGEGLGFWVNLRDQGRSLVDIANTMYATTPARTYFPTFLTNQEIIGAFYTNVLGRTADSEGLAFWTAKLNAPGATPGSVIAEMINVVANYTGTNQDGKDSQALFNNRVQVAQYYAEKNGTVSGAIAVLNGVSKDVATVASVKTAIDNGTVGGVNQGQNYVLTVNQDAGAAFTGTTGNDVFLAGAAQDGNGNLINTLQSVDVLDGGGGIDALQVTLSQPMEVAPTVKNIETINARFTNANAALNLANAVAVTSVVVADTSVTQVGISNIGAIDRLIFKNVDEPVDGTTVALKGAAGSATTLNVELDNVGAAGGFALDLAREQASKVSTLNIKATNAALATFESALATPALKTVNIESTGNNKFWFLAGQTTLENLKVTGAGATDLSFTSFSALKSFDGSAATGALKLATSTNATATITAGAGNDVVNVNAVTSTGNKVALGAGNDVLIAGAKLTNLDGGVDGGEGTDVLNITSAAALTAATAAKVSNIEVLDLSGATTGDYQMDLLNASVQLDAAINNGVVGALTFSAAPDNFVLTVASKAAEDYALGNLIVVTGKDYAGTGASAETFTLKALMRDGDKDNVAEGNITLAGGINVNEVESLVVDATVAVPDGGAANLPGSAHLLKLGINGNKVETLTIKGDASIQWLGNTVGVLNKIDASASTGNISSALHVHTRAISYIGSAGRDEFAGSTAGVTFYGGKGADILTLEAAKAARDTVIFKAASDAQIKDINGDGKFTLGSDVAGAYDVEAIVNFSTANNETGDRLDVTNLGFTGAQRGVVNVSALVTGPTNLANAADLFSTPAGDRGIAYTVVGGHTYVLIDANKDGDFKAADDILVKLTGVAAFSEASVNF